MVDRRRMKSRRTLLKRGAAVTGISGLTGCLRLVGGGSTPTETLGSGVGASFSFDYRSDGTLAIEVTDGGDVTAGRIQIRSSNGQTATWNNLGSTSVAADDTISEGQTAVIGEHVLNWGQEVGRQETIRIVYVHEDGSPSTLVRYSPAEGQTGGDTEEPSTTDTETETRTRSESGRGTLDDFNDGSLSGWEILEGIRSDIEFVSDAKEGARALYLKEADTSVNIIKELPSPVRISSISYWFRYRSGNDNNLQVWLNGGNGDRITQIREFSRGLYYREPPDTKDNKPITGVQENSWYRVRLHRFDFDQNRFDIRIFDSQSRAIGEVSGVDFYNNVDTFGAFQIRDRLGNNNTSDPVWVDEITYTV